MGGIQKLSKAPAYIGVGFVIALGVYALILGVVFYRGVEDLERRFLVRFELESEHVLHDENGTEIAFRPFLLVLPQTLRETRYVMSILSTCEKDPVLSPSSYPVHMTATLYNAISTDTLETLHAHADTETLHITSGRRAQKEELRTRARMRPFTMPYPATYQDLLDGAAVEHRLEPDVVVRASSTAYLVRAAVTIPDVHIDSGDIIWSFQAVKAVY